MRAPLELRPVQDGDLAVLFEQQADLLANAMAGFPPRDRPEFELHWQEILAEPTVLVRAILSDGELAGNILSFEQEGRRLLGYWLGRDYWGRGLATAALQAFLKLELTRPLHAYTLHSNLASQRVLLKCGFQVEGYATRTLHSSAMLELLHRLDAAPAAPDS